VSAKFDQEDLLDSVYQIMTDAGALNTKIAAIEAEKIAKGKGLTPTLASIASDSYYEQSWSDKILQTNPAIFYGVEDVEAVDGGGGAVAKTYTIFVEIVLVDNGMTNDCHKRIARYARALEELFADAYAPAIAGGKLKVKQVRPFSFKLALDSDEEIKVGGVSITIPLF
jgi:hypothetical protein